MTRWLALGAFFFSGVAGLTFEVVWTRYLGLALGTTTLAIATTTAAYMGGLALGSHLGGKLSDRLRRPLAVYGACEIVLALAGLAIAAVYHLVPRVDSLLLSEFSGGASRGLVRFVVAVLVLIAPTTLMGMTLPVLARAVAHRLGEVGREVGTLYAVNIAGAMVGAALAGFWWIPALGLSYTNFVAVVCDALLGSVALVAGLLLPPAPVVTPDEKQLPALRPESQALIAMLAITGATAMALQILWTRALSTALGPSTYAFSAIVCTYLAGLALGAAIASRVADRVTAPRAALAGVLALTGLLAGAGIALVDDLPALLRPVVLDRSLTMGGLLRTEFFLAGLSVLPATLGMGAIFPLTLSAVVGNQAHLGASVGRAYAVNTMGAIVGCFAGVFILLPLLGVEWGMRTAALAYFGVAGFLTIRLEPTLSRRHSKGLRVGVAVGAIVLLAWPGWDVGMWTIGVYRLSTTRAYYGSDQEFKPSRLLFHRDGLSSTVTVEEEAGVRWIKVNGKIDGSSSGDMPTQLLSGLLPVLLHPNPRNVAVIGCGSCVTIGAVLQSPRVEQATLVELEAEVVAAAHLFEEVNYAPWKDPRMRLVEDDGRNFLMRRPGPFEVIISEPSNPWMTGAASLFTREFFHVAKGRLTPDGIFLQWLQVYELAPERIASMLKTFQAAFTHVMVFTPEVDSNDLLMVGSAAPLDLDWAGLKQRFAALRPHMEKAGVVDLSALGALVVLTDKQIRSIPAEVPLNTDDNALIEFGAPTDLLTFAEDDPEVEILEQTRGERVHLLGPLLAKQGHERAKQLGQLALAYLRHGLLEDAENASNAGWAMLGKIEAPAAEHMLEATDEMITLFLDEDAEPPTYGSAVQEDRDYTLAASLSETGRLEEAIRLFNTKPSLSKKSPEHALLHGYLLYRNGEYPKARSILAQAEKESPNEAVRAGAVYYLAKAAFDDGDYPRATLEMTRYRQMLGGDLSPASEAD